MDSSPVNSRSGEFDHGIIGGVDDDRSAGAGMGRIFLFHSTGLPPGEAQKQIITSEEREPMLYYQQTIENIQKGSIQPVYLLFGEEQLLVDDVIKRIKGKFLEKPEPELNLFVRYASENGVDEIISLGSGKGLFFDKKLIILKEADVLKADQVDRLSAFIKKQEPGICLILQTGISNLFHSRLKKIENQVSAVNLLPLREEDLRRYVIDEFKKLEKQITPEAVDVMIFRVGSQLYDIQVQISHIANYFSDQKIIDTPAVEEIASVYATRDVFEFCRHLGGQDLKKAGFVLGNLLESGTPPGMILSQMIRHFTILWKIAGLTRAGIKQSDKLAKELKIFPKYINEYREQSNFWKPGRLHAVFSFLFDADRELKNNTLEPQIILDILTLKIINSK